MSPMPPSHAYYLGAIVVLCLCVVRSEALLGVPRELDIRFLYDVVFSPHPLTAEDMRRVPPERLYPMRQANGSSYICELPDSEEALIAENMNKQRPRLERSEDNYLFHPGDVLPVMMTQPIEHAVGSKGQFVTKRGYWTYILSLGKFVRQQHEYQMAVTDSATGKSEVKTFTNDVFYMGVDTHEWARTTMADSNDPHIARLRQGKTTYTLQRDHEGFYLSSLYTKGDECDLTGGRRQTEVQLRCLENGDLDTDTSMDIQEVGTCTYIAKLYDRRACIQGFIQRPPKRLSMVCHPIVKRKVDDNHERYGDL